jgi:MoaA/NifB/PqqE/SkfB family radical SAM enzyme
MVLPKDIEDIQSIQLETTSRCNLECITCLKPAYSGSWLEREMDDSLFHRILRQIPPKTSVHLQGWGEPLLHPAILEHIGKLKEKGAHVSFTTNGTIMDKNMAAALIQSELDGLTFSMAGASREVQDGLRGAHSFDRLRRSINIFNTVRNEYTTTFPQVAVSYLLTPETVEELPGAVTWCRANGVDAFVTVHLTQAACESQQQLQFLLSENETRSYRLLRIHTQTKALFSKMRLDLGLFHSTLTPVCGKNPLNTLFISANGDVSPCVFLCPPVNDGIAWRYGGGQYLQKPVVFGNVHKASLSEIWEQPEYQRFRAFFKARKKFHDSRLSGISCSLAGSAQLDAAVAAIKEFFSENPVPKPCRYCAKIDGY